MIIASVHFTWARGCRPGCVDPPRNRDASLKEPGVIRFEVGRGSEKPNAFALWELYRDQAALDAHRTPE